MHVCCKVEKVVGLARRRARSQKVRGVEPKNCAKSKECRLFKDAMVESPPIPAISKRANESRIGRCLILRSRRQSHDGEELRHRRPPEPSSSGPSESAIIAENPAHLALLSSLPRRQQKQDEMVNNNRPEPDDEAHPPPHLVVPNGHPDIGLFDR